MASPQLRLLLLLHVALVGASRQLPPPSRASRAGHARAGHAGRYLSGHGPTLRLLPVGDETTAAALTYRRALWYLMRRDEALKVEFVGSLGEGDLLGVPGAQPAGRRHEGHAQHRVDQIAKALPGWLGNAYTDLRIDVSVVWAGMGDLKGGKSEGQLLADLTALVNVLQGMNAGANTTTLICTLPSQPVAGQPGMFTSDEVGAKVAAFNARLPGAPLCIHRQPSLRDTLGVCAACPTGTGVWISQPLAVRVHTLYILIYGVAYREGRAYISTSPCENAPGAFAACLTGSGLHDRRLGCQPRAEAQRASAGE
jgi:hypothetical protein